MEKTEEFLKNIISPLDAQWNACEEESQQAKRYGDIDQFRALRIKQGAITMSMILVLSGYRKTIGEYPVALRSYFDQLHKKLGTRTKLKGR